MPVSKLLVVDDEQTICWGLSRLGESIGLDVATASSAEQALDIVRRHSPDLIILDVRLPGMDGLAAMKRLRREIGPVPVIVITAYGDLQTAVEAVRNGAFEYIVKPFELDRVEQAVLRALEKPITAGDELPQRDYVGGLVGQGPAMQEVFKRIALAAASDASVLLSGESGTGKELAARAIHRYSRRSDGPLVAVNVASLSPALAESELFGHCRGAFTGAEQARRGLLAQADGGTLFLDEVADIPLPVQVKLLRALELGEITPVGSSDTIRSDFRVISATHQPLTEQVTRGRFRHDLYFRLSAFPIEIPPLRDRPEDIEELALHFLRAGSRSQSGSLPVLPPETVAELRRRPWYGNVRELCNAMQHALILARGGAIRPQHLPEPAGAAVIGSAAQRDTPDRIVDLIRQWAKGQLTSQDAAEIYQQFLELVEPPLLGAALDDSKGQHQAAARKLGVHRTTLKKKLQQHGLDDAAGS